MLPLLKQGSDGIKKVGEAAKEMGDALNNDQIAAVDRFGDAMNRLANTAANSVVAAFAAAILKIEQFASWINKLRGDIGSMTRESLGGEIKTLEARLGQWNDPASRPKDRMGNPISVDKLQSDLAAMKSAYKANGFDRMDYEDKAKAGGFATAATQVSGYHIKNGKMVKDAPAGKGGGVKEMSDAEKELNRIRQEGERITERNRTAYEKYAIAVQEAQKALKAGAIDQTTYQRELLRLQAELTEETTKGADAATVAMDELAVSIRSSLANAFEDAIFEAKDFSSGMTTILDGIARQIARKGFIDPLANSVSGLIGNAFGGSSGGGLLSGIGSFFGGMFADGGSPPVGLPSIVGERGPEIFVPKTAGMIVPNHALGGQAVTVQNNWHIGGGVTKQELANLIPYIEQRTKAAVFQSIERGGTESRMVNRKS